MAKAKLKTTETKVSVTAFIKDVEDDAQRADCRRLMKMMRAATGKAPKMWGPSIVGYDKYHYKYDSGREGDSFRIGFSPRKGKISVYIMPALGPFASQLKRLGKFKSGKSCLNIKKLEDVDEAVLTELLDAAVALMKKKYD